MRRPDGLQEEGKGSLPPTVLLWRQKGCYFSRDESWLRFNERVLEEAQDETNPLLERVKFLAITASNLDEFVEIRVAGILQHDRGWLQRRRRAPDEGGLTPEERLERLSASDGGVCDAQYRVLERAVAAGAGAETGSGAALEGAGQTRRGAGCRKFYEDEVDPLLTPVTIDPSHPFPRVLNKALCIALLLRHKRSGPKGMKAGTVLGVVTVPRALPRLICLPARSGE